MRQESKQSQYCLAHSSVCVRTLTRRLYYIHTLYNTNVHMLYITQIHTFTWYIHTTIHTCVFIHIYILTKNLQMYTSTCMGSRTHMATAGVINVTVFPLKGACPTNLPLLPGIHAKALTLWSLWENPRERKDRQIV